MGNPNTHPLCDMRDTWTECSQCYTYVHWNNNFFNFETEDNYFEDHTCVFTISTNCDSDFVDRNGNDCEYYRNNLFGECEHGRNWYLDIGVMTDKGFMTALNCPQCGCDETNGNGPIRHDFLILHDSFQDDFFGK